MSKELDAIGLAACLHRIRLIAKSRPHEEKEDLYWTVREACAVVARERRITWFDILSFEKGLFLEDDNKYQELSSPFWDLVVPPQIVVEEAMSS